MSTQTKNILYFVGFVGAVLGGAFLLMSGVVWLFCWSFMIPFMWQYTWGMWLAVIIFRDNTEAQIRKLAKTLKEKSERQNVK